MNDGLSCFYQIFVVSGPSCRLRYIDIKLCLLIQLKMQHKAVKIFVLISLCLQRQVPKQAVIADQ